MTRLEVLDIALEAATQNVEATQKATEEIVDTRTSGMEKVVKTFFEGAFEEGDNVEVGNSYSDEVVLRVNRQRTEDGYASEILSVRFRAEYGETEFSKIETNFYSTNSSDRFELERMRTLGLVGTTLLDYGDDILAELNAVKTYFNDRVKEAREKQTEAQKALRQVRQMIEDIKQENLEEQLSKEGVEFEGTGYNSPQFEIKFDRVIYNVKRVKLLGKTASGKSAKIAITRVFDTWNQETEEYVKKEHTFEETVRMDKLNLFLRAYKSKMIA